jgi:hypothetical protein
MSRTCRLLGHRWIHVIGAAQGCIRCGTYKVAWDDGSFSNPGDGDWLWHTGVPEGTLLPWNERRECTPRAITYATRWLAQTCLSYMGITHRGVRMQIRPTAGGKTTGKKTE